MVWRKEVMQIIDQSYEILSEIDSDYILKFIEHAGRTAYKSEDKITFDSAETFIRQIIKRGHESVLEHFNITVKFITDRGVTHELVRHRLCAYTQESTRYCNYSKKGMTFIKPVFWQTQDELHKLALWENWRNAMITSENIYNRLLIIGASPQEARSVLPNSLKTEIVTTTNLREWRHILKLRTSKAAHPQMRALMTPLLNELKTILPILFDDIEIEVNNEQ
jgi:thymidylate synthase (FAD)